MRPQVSTFFWKSVEINFASHCIQGYWPLPSLGRLAQVWRPWPTPSRVSSYPQLLGNSSPMQHLVAFHVFSPIRTSIIFACLQPLVLARDSPCLGSACRKSVTTLSIITPPSRHTQTYMYSWGHRGFGSLSRQPFIGRGVHAALTSAPNDCSNLQIVTEDLGCYMLINIWGRISSTGFRFNVGCFQLNLFLQICFCKLET